MPITPLSGSLGEKRAAHLLRRACFGGSISEIKMFAALTAEEAFDRLYSEELAEPTPPIDPETGSDWLSGVTDLNSEEGNLLNFLGAWHMRQMLGGDATDDQKLAYIFRERLVFYLHTHFTTKQSVVQKSISIYYQLALFRKFAFDRDDWEVPNEEYEEGSELPETIIIPVNFKRLTVKISVDNAMLAFLDGRLNIDGRPNENYARELLELFSIGRGLEGEVPETGEGDYYNYTEQDVQEAAKILSGFDVDTTYSVIDEETEIPRGKTRGNGVIAAGHDNSFKEFSERFDGTIIQPDSELLRNGTATPESAINEIEQLVDMIYSKEETARYLCRRLYRFFIYHEIDATIDNDIIQSLATIFVDGGYKLYPVLRALLTSQEFYDGVDGYDDDSLGSIIKSPLDLILGTIRSTDVTVPSADEEVTSNYSFGGSILRQLGLQGMDYYEPFEVAGYPAYHQYPVYNRSWITTNYLIYRYDFINGLQAGTFSFVLDPYTFVKNNIDDAVARDAKMLITALAAYFLPMAEVLSYDDGDVSELTAQRLNYFLNAFLYENNVDVDPEASWTINWDSTADVEKMTGQLRNLFNALLQSPEYQLM